MAMQRARRLASVAVIATLAVTGLAACRSAPDVAVYFGQSATVSVAEVERVYADARDKLQAARDAAGQNGQDAGATTAAAAPVQVPFDGPDVVSAIVGHDVVTRLAQAQNVTLPAQLPLDRAAQSIGLPPDAEYVRLYTETRLLFDLLMQKASPVQTAEADLEAVFRVFEDTGAMQAGTTYEQFKSQVPPEALQTLGRAVAVRNQVREQLDQLDVRVNPRYEAAEVTVYAEPGPNNETLSLVAVPLAAAGTSPVTDAA
ncbi:MAG TPA: hypothetical protein VFR35_06035 [Actinoplanes sp.]|nr:hypothetical protein [Actinoplanes sp.]